MQIPHIMKYNRVFHIAASLPSIVVISLDAMKDTVQKHRFVLRCGLHVSKKKMGGWQIAVKNVKGRF
jgi:hypothetical protein